MAAAASYILALGFIFLPLVSSVNKGITKTSHEIAYGTVVDYSVVKISYPFMARIIMDGSFRCGGALISDRFVATARHCLEYCPCFDEANPSNDWTRCGTCIIKLRENSDYISDTETVHTIKTIYLPQNSGSPYDTRGQRTDFALVELASSANSCSQEETEKSLCWKVSPVRLPDPYIHIKEGQRVRTLGWGATELSFDDEQSEFLAQLDVTVNSSTLFHFLLETNVGRNGADPCRGDSGGPLLLRGEDLEWTLVGTLVGGGYECGNPGGKDTSSDWNKIALHVPWINSVIGSGVDTVVDEPATGQENTGDEAGKENTGNKPDKGNTDRKTGIKNTSTAILITGGWETKFTTEVYFPSTNKGCIVQNYELPANIHTHTMNTFENKTLLCGGGDAKSYCLEFSPTSLSSLSTVWPKYANLTEARYEHTSWVSSAGIVLIGGYGPYSAKAETTAELVSGGILPFTLPPTRDACAIGDASSDSFILTGGAFTLFNVTRYNLKGLVDTLPNMNRGRSWHACGSYESAGKMVIIVAGGGLHLSTEKLVIGESRWSLASPLPSIMSIPTSLNINNKMYILGGRGRSDIDILTDILEYDADLDVWGKVGDMQVARYRHAAAVIYADFEDLCSNPCDKVYNSGFYLDRVSTWTEILLGQGCKQLKGSQGGSYLEPKACRANCNTNPTCKLWKTEETKSRDTPWCWNYGTNEGNGCHDARFKNAVEPGIYSGLSGC